MKMNKDQFFSALVSGKVKNFVYNGVKYYAEDSNLTGKHSKMGYKEAVVKNPEDVIKSDLDSRSLVVIKVDPGKDSSSITKAIKANLVESDPDIVEAKIKGLVNLSHDNDYVFIKDGISPQKVLDIIKTFKPVGKYDESDTRVIIFKK